MTQNPFDALGGGFDMNALLQQAQQMQQQLEEAQAALAQQTVDGTVAGGAVTVTANGVGELVGVTIRAGEFDGTDPDDLSDLSDLIVAAYRDARAKSEALAGDSLGGLTEGLGGSGGGAGGGLGFPPPSLG
ncbi:YbaB/EbfC family nucleoid-associated protein [Nocardioides KLBMP 9356]|uniref:Nucleoid-associated protein L2K70_10695 n=1 Tax=Nocardioides potassii TaxID=2911371 RepID=A0ABS9HCC9_9ACTN|nr:YbaB/EbfC family nucleoid-associated protein [Nocardioides potassii]MCF6378074.1 YbaB/EbfC family nucleoid-associated protein [Nocardioides potassii]